MPKELYTLVAILRMPGETIWEEVCPSLHVLPDSITGTQLLHNIHHSLVLYVSQSYFETISHYIIVCIDIDLGCISQIIVPFSAGKEYCQTLQLHCGVARLGRGEACGTKCKIFL